MEPEPANDERFAADVVGPRAGPELGEAPRCGVDGDDDADASDRKTLRGEEEGNQAPYQGIVEVVHQSGLAHRGERWVAQRGDRKGLPKRLPGTVLLVVLARFSAGVMLRLAHHDTGEREADDGDAESHDERPGSRPIRRSDRAGGPGGDRDRAVAGGLVEAERKPPAGRSGKIDLHVDRGRPGETLVEPEEHIGRDDPGPRRCPDDHGRDRQGGDPSADEHTLSAVAVSEVTGGKVRKRLCDPERDQERQHG